MSCCIIMTLLVLCCTTEVFSAAIGSTRSKTSVSREKRRTTDWGIHGILDKTTNKTETLDNRAYTNQENNDYNCLQNQIPLQCRQVLNHCFICKEGSTIAGVTAGETVCYFSNNTELDQIFRGLNKTTELLQLVILNKWKGYLPSTPSAIDITRLATFTKLKSFKLAPCNEEYKQPYPINFTKDTFRNLSSLSSLSINIASVDQSLANVVSHLHNLKTLDLSFTRKLSMANVIDTIKAVNATSLRFLYLLTFQCVGCDGYNFSLRIPTFFSNRNFPALEELVISENSLARISPGLSRIAPNLRFLDISGNILLDAYNGALIIEVLLQPSIKVLDMAYQGYVGGGKFHYKHNHIRPDDNKIGVGQARDLRKSYKSPDQQKDPIDSKSDRYIVSCFNKHTEIYSSPNISALFSYATQQNKIILYNILKCLFPTVFAEGPPTDVIPELRDIVNISCALFINIPLSPNLETLYMNQLHFEATSIPGIKVGTNFCFKKNNLTNFVFTDNAYWVKAAEIDDLFSRSVSINGLDKLASLDISNNGLSASFKPFTKNLYPSVQNFSIANNNITLDRDYQVCRQQPILQRLDFSGNSLGKKPNFPYKLVSGCYHLIKLDLSNNHFNNSEDFSLNISDLQSLRILNISNNHLTTIGQEMRNAIDETAELSSELFIDLEHNPLVCNCQTLPFTKWVTNHVKQRSSKVKFHKYDHYKCLGIYSRVRKLSTITPEKVDKFQRHSHPSNAILNIKIVSITLACVLFVLLVYTLYRKRWRLRYLLFVLKQKIQRLLRSTEKTTPEEWKYDAFVSYCSDDRFWVHGEFRRTLEHTYGFRLCLHYRDFEVGDTISNAILESIKQSRETIIIISDAALTHEWNQFELEHSNLQSGRRKKRLIMVKMGKLRHIAKNPLAANLLDLHGYTEWSEHTDRIPVFWESLVEKLYGKSHTAKHCSCHCFWRCCHKHQGYQQITDSQDRGSSTDR